MTLLRLFLFKCVFSPWTAYAWNKSFTENLCTTTKGEVLRVKFDSPKQGGHAVTYEILNADKKVVQTFALINRLNEGDGLTEEKITVPECKANMRRLLSWRRNNLCDGVAVYPKGCSDSGREAVSVSK